MTTEADIRNEDLILYIVTKLKNCNSFGSVMLNKVLYYSDNIHYLSYGRPISSFKYINQDLGPIPEPASFIPLRQKLIKEGKVKEEVSDGVIRTRKKLVALKTYNSSFFSEEELKIVNEVIDDLKNHSAIELSDKSHFELGWQLTEKNERIPLNAFLLSVPELTENDFVWAASELTKVSAK